MRSAHNVEGDGQVSDASSNRGASAWSAGGRQNADARDGGIAVNANGQNVHVEIHQERDPEVVRLLKSLQEGRKSQKAELSDLRRDSNEHQRLLEELADGIEQVLHTAREPHPSATALAAITDLEAGSSLGAEALLRESERVAAAKRPPDVSRAAQLARQQGALATYRNTESALAAYQRAAAYEPDNPDNWQMLGDVLMDALRRPEAAKAYERLQMLAAERLKETPTDIARRSALAASYIDGGDHRNAHALTGRSGASRGPRSGHISNATGSGYSAPRRRLSAEKFTPQNCRPQV